MECERPWRRGRYVYFLFPRLIRSFGSSKILFQRSDLDWVDDKKWTLLHFAAKYGSLPLINLLLEKKPNVWLVTTGGPIIFSLRYFPFRLCSFHVSDNCYVFLFSWIRMHSPSFLLLSHWWRGGPSSPPYNPRETHSLTTHCLVAEFWKVFYILSDRWAFFVVVDFESSTLCEASMNCTFYRETPLHYAMMARPIPSLPLISFLLSRGASSKVESVRGYTPLDYLHQSYPLGSSSNFFPPSVA